MFQNLVFLKGHSGRSFSQFNELRREMSFWVWYKVKWAVDKGSNTNPFIFHSLMMSQESFVLGSYQPYCTFLCCLYQHMLLFNKLQNIFTSTLFMLCIYYVEKEFSIHEKYIDEFIIKRNNLWPKSTLLAFTLTSDSIKLR